MQQSGSREHKSDYVAYEYTYRTMNILSGLNIAQLLDLLHTYPHIVYMQDLTADLYICNPGANPEIKEGGFF